MLDHAHSEINIKQALFELGIAVSQDSAPGFPVSLPMRGGQAVTIDLEQPAGLDWADADEIGVAVLDRIGCPILLWGLARRVSALKEGKTVLGTNLSGLLEAEARGSHGAIYLDGYRYFSSGSQINNSGNTIVLLTNARDEQRARRSSGKNQRIANAFRRIGKALTMNQTTLHTCVATAHEMASCLDLATVLIWTWEPESESLVLRASVGVNRIGLSALGELRPKSPVSAADLVALEKVPFIVEHVSQHMLTAELESRFSYLKPGGVCIQPLIISDKLVGVLEIVGKNGDTNFNENIELFQTLAEHLALALNSAAMFEQAEKLASNDALTGIANHRALQEFLAARLNECERTNDSMALIMADVDHFRSFNEEEGHDAGDTVLKLVAQQLKKAVRPYDLAARYGGEEFTIILPSVDSQKAFELAERLRKSVEELEYVTPTGRVRRVTISLGIAMYPTTSLTASDLFKAADHALYDAKKGGRNRTCAYLGLYQGESKRTAIDMNEFSKKLKKSDREAGLRSLDQCSHSLGAVRTSLNLSDSQFLILKALMIALPAFENGAELHQLDEWRLIGPSLGAYKSRFDEDGDKIPLLARVLSVLVALSSGGHELQRDPGKFDPEIISKILDRPHAA